MVCLIISQKIALMRRQYKYSHKVNQIDHRLNKMLMWTVVVSKIFIVLIEFIVSVAIQT